MSWLESKDVRGNGAGGPGAQRGGGKSKGVCGAQRMDDEQADRLLAERTPG
jgi:hypothetical protein